jgi:two-component system, LytTR family, response regulator
MPDPLRVAIVDDEAPARAALRVLLADRSDVDIVEECRNGREAVEAIHRVAIDLLLLDIEMPGLDGFGVVEEIGPEHMPLTMFITAHDEHALRAFEIDAIDYILKPFDRSRFFAAFDRAVRRISERRTAEWASRLSNLLGRRLTPAAHTAQSKLPVPVGDRVVFVPIDEIDWIEAADQYVVVHAGRREFTLRQTIQSVLLKLPPRKFAQIHRSHAVNVARVSEVVKLGKGDAQVVLTTGRELRLSRRFRDRLRESFGWPL